MTRTRRSFLRAGAAALATGSLGALAGCSGDGGEGTTTATPPRVRFDHRYDPVDGERGRVRLAHDGGEPLTAEALFVVGEGFASVDGVDQTKRGPWQGEATDGEVRTGDAVVVGATSNYELTLSYQGDDGNVILGTATGPGE